MLMKKVLNSKQLIDPLSKIDVETAVIEHFLTACCESIISGDLIYQARLLALQKPNI